MSQLIYNDLKQLIGEFNSSSMPTEILLGTIVSLSPIQVHIDGNSEYYPSRAFVIPEHLTDREIEVEYEGTNTAMGEGLSFTGKMTIKNGLKEGDSVLLVQCQGGQKLVVLDRVPE